MGTAHRRSSFGHGWSMCNFAAAIAHVIVVETTVTLRPSCVHPPRWLDPDLWCSRMKSRDFLVVCNCCSIYHTSSEENHDIRVIKYVLYYRSRPLRALAVYFNS